MVPAQDRALLLALLRQQAVFKILSENKANARALKRAAGGGGILSFSDEEDADAGEPDGVIFTLDPALRRAVDVREDHGLPEQFTARMGAEEFRSYLVQRNGQAVARVVERPLGERTVALVAAPPEALALAPVLYASILVEASEEPVSAGE